MKVEVSRLKRKNISLLDVRSGFLMIMCLLFSMHSDMLEIDGQLTKSFWYNVMSISSFVLYVVSNISIRVSRNKLEEV